MGNGPKEGGDVKHEYELEQALSTQYFGGPPLSNQISDANRG